MHEWLLDPAAYDLAAHAESLVDTVITGLRIAPPRQRVAALASNATSAGSARRAGREKIAA
jgi:hypothetical protein